MPLIAALAVLPAFADPVPCPGGQVLTDQAGEAAPLICEAAARATRQLASCGLTVPAPVTISIVEALEENCLGLYHCGEQRIEILHPVAYSEMLEGHYSGAFATTTPGAFFEGILRHELTHAALDAMPCPFESCVVGQEYVAHNMQVMFLPETDRTAFESVDPHDGPVPRNMMNQMILFMAPDVFARRAWQHLTERGDQCAYIGHVARGEILLDFEHP